MDENIGRPKTFQTSAEKTDLGFYSFIPPNINRRNLDTLIIVCLNSSSLKFQEVIPKYLVIYYNYLIVLHLYMAY